MKAAQVKNYKKQVDSLQDELKMSQQNVDTLLKTQEELVKCTSDTYIQHHMKDQHVYNYELQL